MPKAKIERHAIPTIFQVAGIIIDTWKWEHHTADVDSEAHDVRLVVGRRGTSWFGHWNVVTGSSDYDQWHGLCGASSYDVTKRPTMKAATDIARELVAQIREQAAEDRP